MSILRYPSIRHDVKRGPYSFAGGTLVCHYSDKPVKVAVPLVDAIATYVAEARAAA